MVWVGVGRCEHRYWADCLLNRIPVTALAGFGLVQETADSQ